LQTFNNKFKEGTQNIKFTASAKKFIPILSVDKLIKKEYCSQIFNNKFKGGTQNIIEYNNHPRTKDAILRKFVKIRAEG